MAKFVLAGKTDCPRYAKAELLADKLQKCLPNFRINKMPILPDQWKKWLEDTCRRNGWKHERSPLVWRELVYQGGKAMLLGGFDDFMKHCEDYYNIKSDMRSDMMRHIAAENHEASMALVAEEQNRASLIKPLHIWICSSLSPTACFLIPDLLSGEVFPNVAAISLHLLDLEGDEEELQQLKIETEDLASPMLHQVTIHTDLTEAFKEADVILLLEEQFAHDDDDDDDDEEEERRKMVKKTWDRYREYGQLMDTRAKKEVKVIVSGDSFVNLRCWLLLENARSINSGQFVAMATQLKNKARMIIARKLKVKTADVTDVIVWGNISGSFYVDLQRAHVFNYPGAVRGPSFFSQPVLKICQDSKWVEQELQELVRCHHADVALKTRKTVGLMAANGIIPVLKAWSGNGDNDEIFSLGVHCEGCYKLPGDLILSFPVTLKDGKWSKVLDVTVGEELMDKLLFFTSEVLQEKALGAEESLNA